MLLILNKKMNVMTFKITELYDKAKKLKYFLKIIINY